MAAVTTFGRERADVAEDAPLGSDGRAVARLLASLSLVGMVAVVIAGAAVWCGGSAAVWCSATSRGARTTPTTRCPNCSSRCCWAAFAVSLGAALAQVLRHPAGRASIVAFWSWFLLGGTYWVFDGPVLQGAHPAAGAAEPGRGQPHRDRPLAFPADWLLSVPGEYQDHWARMVVSPAFAASHDLYLVALTALLGAAAVPGR